MATLDTLQDSVNILTASTTTLVNEVQVKKATLDASVADAESAQTGAQSARDTAEGHKLAAETAATSATNTAAALTGFDLDAIAQSKAVTAVDVFVYDTSKDSDGGAWRKRTQGTSWYQEALNTATRGARREFPSVAVIVAETNKVTIYDGDDPSLPMWMVFINDHRKKGIPVVLVGGAGITVGGLAALNGTICWSNASVSYGGLIEARFASDSGNITTGAGWNSSFDCKANIAQRNTTDETNGSTSVAGPLVNKAVNDVAMTVLPDAPIDAATGLPVPTIAVATDGGVSVIKDDGTVVDITHSANNFASGVDFRADGAIVYGVDGLSTRMRFVHVDHQIPTSDVSKGSGLYGTDSDEFYPQSSSNWTNTSLRLLPDNYSGAKPLILNEVVSSNLGVNFLSTVPSAPTTGMVAYTTSTYNTGWQQGDIKGAFLSDTDTTSLVGSGELVTNGTFDTDTDWTLEDGWSIAGGVLSKATGSGNGRAASQAVNFVAGRTYLVEFDYTDQGSDIAFGYGTLGNSAGLLQNNTALSGTGPKTITITPSFDGGFLGFRGNNSSVGQVDNISVRLADADRSVNANGLIVNGTITKTPVATGADLVAYSGFSASNYLEQPYNSDLDFGTGDFSVMGWVNPTSANLRYLFDRRVFDDGSNLARLSIYRNTNGTLTAPIFDQTSGSAAPTSSTAVTQDVWSYFALVRSGGVAHWYINGVASGSLAANYNVSSPATNHTVTVGARHDLSSALQGSLALLRVSATAPTAEQIAKIYNDEKALFQENAQATLYGSSDAVTALAHDSDTDLLHVGTSDGRSVFQGLRRVSNTTNAVGTAISASNGLVVEE